MYIKDNKTPALFGGRKMFPKGAKCPKWPTLSIFTIFKLIEIYKNGYWSWHGKYEGLFLKSYCEFLNVKYGIMTTSGTSALDSALAAIGVSDNDEVIVPAITWVTTATSVLFHNAKPVIVDVEPDTLCISPEKIEKAITPRTKAIIPVHIFSAVCDMDKIMDIAKKHNLFVIEDCAQAHGAQWNGQSVGTIGDIGVYSFQQSKLLNCGEGGICLTNNLKLASRIEKYVHIGYGFNRFKLEKDLLCKKYVLSEFQMAILFDQLKSFVKQNEIRAKNVEILEKMFKNIPGIKLQSSSNLTSQRAFYYLTFLLKKDELKENISKNDILKALNAEGLPCDSAWGSIVSEYNLWNIPENKYVQESVDVARNACAEQIITLPHTFLLCKESEIIKIARTFEKIMTYYCKS